MLDRQKIEAILTRRFAGATHSQIAAATNAIMGLDDEWEELLGGQPEFGYQYSADCREISSLAPDDDRGAEFRFFRRRESSPR